MGYPTRLLRGGAAAPAGDGLEDLDLFAVLFDEVADEDEAVVAAVGPETLGA